MSLFGSFIFQPLISLGFPSIVFFFNHLPPIIYLPSFTSLVQQDIIIMMTCTKIYSKVVFFKSPKSSNSSPFLHILCLSFARQLLVYFEAKCYGSPSCHKIPFLFCFIVFPLLICIHYFLRAWIRCYIFKAHCRRILSPLLEF